MPFTLNYFNFFVLYAVNQTIDAIYATRPPAGQITAQRLWLADAFIAATLNIPDEMIDPFERRFIVRLPVKVSVSCPVRP
jgi:hypothetical protein